MNFITKLVRPTLTTHLRASFSKDIWKERDQSAEKVYISAEESNWIVNAERSLDRLLEKMEQSEHNPGVKDVKFEQCLKEILIKYQVNNEAL